jgi:hypothetical protein
MLDQSENGSLPRSHVQVESSSQQIVAIPLVTGPAKLILQLPFLAGEVRQRQSNMTLALVGCVNQEVFRSPENFLT